MKVRALHSFVDESARRHAGDVFDMEEHLALYRIRSGLVQRVPEEPRTTTAPEPELAVLRRRKGH